VMDLLRGESMRKINETNTWETPSETSKIGGTTNRDRNREDLVGGTWKKMSVQQKSHSHRGSSRASPGGGGGIDGHRMPRPRRLTVSSGSESRLLRNRPHDGGRHTLRSSRMPSIAWCNSRGVLCLRKSARTLWNGVELVGLHRWEGWAELRKVPHDRYQRQLTRRLRRCRKE
jgi:hypothetical protein